MDAITAATIVDQGHSGHDEDIDHEHDALDEDNLDNRKLVIKDMNYVQDQDHHPDQEEEISVAHGILPRAVSCILERLCFIGLPQLCNIVCQRIVGVGCREKSLDGEKDGSNLKSRTPLLLQDVQADSPKLVYVWVVDPCDEPDLRIIVIILMILMI